MMDMEVDKVPDKVEVVVVVVWLLLLVLLC